MDLHDFRDVAENYDRYLEVMYTQGTDHHEGFQEFYLDLARKYGSGGVVDVACGTGAVLLYLAERGISVDGTDLSEEMCKVASAKAEALGLSLNIIPADMTKFSSGKKYSLAIIARSGFMHLPDQALQIAALKNLNQQTDLESTLNMDEVLRYFVVHNFVVNGDSYTGSIPSTPGRRYRQPRCRRLPMIIPSVWNTSTMTETGKRFIMRSVIILIRSR